MHPIARLTLAAAVGVFAATLSFGTQAAAYIKFDGVDGESRIEASAQAFVWTGASAGPGFDPFQPVQARGVYVAAGDVNGDGVEQATMSFGLTGVGDVMQYQMTGAGPGWYGVTPTAPDAATWSFESFESVVMRWRPELPTGGRGDWIEGRWDAATGRFTGDAAVLGAFDDLGATRWADGSLSINAAVPEPATGLLMLAGAGTLALRRRAAAG